MTNIEVFRLRDKESKFYHYYTTPIRSSLYDTVKSYTKAYANSKVFVLNEKEIFLVNPQMVLLYTIKDAV
jgi:hypothetical protein